MTVKVFETALGVEAPWAVESVDFDESAKVLTVMIDFKPGTWFAVSGHEGVHPVHDTVVKTYRHLNFFQHECCLHGLTATPRTHGNCVCCYSGRSRNVWACSGAGLSNGLACGQGDGPFIEP